MKVELLPSTFDGRRGPSARQHLTCFIVNDCVAFDAGSLAMSCSDAHMQSVRDIVLTHAHLDHIAGLPIFIDDLFSTLTEPIRIYASREVIEVLERDVFNWSVYPKFSELNNANGAVMEYRPFQTGQDFSVKGLRIRAVNVNHRVPASGFLIGDGDSVIALSGDTAEMDGFWDEANGAANLSALLIECAFPNELQELADVSHHLTPETLKGELTKFEKNCPIYVINLKPMLREQIIDQIMDLKISNVEILDIGRAYEW